ncbi:MAG: Soluble epoxide hydrolase [Alphaproteobacteria bacterium MarineAlpha10_Bin3]|jgi:pimeloyl-ACP methyl ester carboxylesterase|nr:MAG: Soluble epoxide hydrolase [Alphaproteobacteria bacterium MarineAlpha10_Bin3]PPR74921.1 MAG: Soluble epoxide hydrolase [Alphaproteobacteria bacterium MarineAlpha4_Bin1]
MPLFQYNGATVHYGDAGSGDIVVLMHAAGSSGAQWRGVLPHLTGRYRVITPDLYGHGRTDFWPDPDTLRHEDQAALLHAVLRDIGATSIDLVGHSYGGTTALRLMLQNPDLVRRFVIIEPMLLNLLVDAGEDDVLADLYTMAKGFLHNVEVRGPETAWKIFLDFRNGDGAWEGYPQKTRDNFLHRTQGHVANLKSNMKNQTPASELATIATPTLAVKTQDATGFDGRMVEILADAMPDCTLVTLKGCGHMVPLTHPELAAEVILGHIAD